MKDTLNGKNADALARRLRPEDYVEGRGLSPEGEKHSAALHAADAAAEQAAPIESDESWESINTEDY